MHSERISVSFVLGRWSKGLRFKVISVQRVPCFKGSSLFKDLRFTVILVRRVPCFKGSSLFKGLRFTVSWFMALWFNGGKVLGSSPHCSRIST